MGMHDDHSYRQTGHSFDLISPTRNFKIQLPTDTKPSSGFKNRNTNNIKTENNYEEQHSLDVSNLYNNTIASLKKNSKDKNSQIQVVDFVNSAKPGK